MDTTLFMNETKKTKEIKGNEFLIMDKVDSQSQKNLEETENQIHQTQNLYQTSNRVKEDRIDRSEAKRIEKERFKDVLKYFVDISMKQYDFEQSESLFGDEPDVLDIKDKLTTYINFAFRKVEYGDNAQENKIIALHEMNILYQCLQQAYQSCNYYLLNNKPGIFNKSKYKKISSIFHDLSEELSELSIQKEYFENGDYDFGTLNGRSIRTCAFIIARRRILGENINELVIPDNGNGQITINGKKYERVEQSRKVLDEKINATRIADLIGLDLDGPKMMKYQENFASKKELIKSVEQNETFESVLQSALRVKYTPAAYKKLLKIQVFDVLYGVVRNPNELKPTYTKMDPYGAGENFAYLIRDVSMAGKYGELSDNTELDISSMNFSGLDPKVKERLYSLRDKFSDGNRDFLNQLFPGLHESEEGKQKLEGFVQRLNALCEKFDSEKENRAENELMVKDNSYAKMIYENSSIENQVSESILFNGGTDINHTMHMIQNPVFHVQKNTHKIRSSKAQKVASAFRRVLSLPNMIINRVRTYFRKGANLILPSNTSIQQKKRDMEAVPGKLNTNESFKTSNEILDEIESKDDNQEVIGDTRMVPLAFERAIPEDVEEPPYISLKVEQPKEGETESSFMNMGHAMIELSYTRKNKKTGQKSRYRTRFGFYPKSGAFANPISLVGAGVLVPGSIINDIGHRYTIGKRFVANNKQINRVIAFTNEYEKGGYNYFTRSCSTFAVDALKAAGIHTPIAQKTNVKLPGIQKAGAILLSAAPVSGLFTMFNNIQYKKYGKRDDLSYKNFGQKYLTDEEYERLYDFHTNDIRGYTPAVLAENIRAERKTDEIMDAAGYPEEGPVVRYKSINDYYINLSNSIDKLERSLANQFSNDISAELIHKRIENMTVNLSKIGELTNDVDSDDMLNRKKNSDTNKKNIPVIIRTLNELITDCGDLYDNFFKKDKRSDIPIYHLITDVNNMKEYIYDVYSNYRQNQQEKKLSDFMALRSHGGVWYNFKITKDDGEEKENSRQYRLREIIAALEVFDSIEDYANAWENYSKLDKKNKQKKLKGNDKKMYIQIRKRLELVGVFEVSHEHYFEEKELDAKFSDLAFNTIPAKQKNITFTAKGFGPINRSSFEGPSHLLQYEAFDKLFNDIWVPEGEDKRIKFDSLDGLPEVISKALNAISEKLNSDENIASQFRYIINSVSDSLGADNSQTQVTDKVTELLLRSFIWPSIAFEFEEKYFEKNNINLLDMRNKNVVVTVEHFSEFCSTSNINLTTIKETINMISRDAD